jgi:hypothetical protein
MTEEDDSSAQGWMDSSRRFLQLTVWLRRFHSQRTIEKLRTKELSSESQCVRRSLDVKLRTGLFRKQPSRKEGIVNCFGKRGIRRGIQRGMYESHEDLSD